MDSQNEQIARKEAIAPPSKNEGTALRIEVSMAPRLSLAFHQNAVPVLRELTLVNEGEAALESVELTLSSEPAFLARKIWRIDAVPAGQRYHVPKLDVALDGALLGRLTEAESAAVTIRATVGGEEAATTTLPIELLPRNQWGGLGHMPEMAAAFIQPNDPAVERLLKATAEILRRHGKSGSLDGYVGGAKRVWELASALWGAVAALGLDYALPPPSFEHAGQKVRGPSQIVEFGLATCLDTTLLFCAALEHCGLNPLVVFTHGHAFVGLWLVKEEFATPVVDDVTALRKRVKLKELVLFETTFVAQRPCPAFSRAVEQGARQIAETAADAFELAVDVRRTRLQRIRPLASAGIPVAAATDAPAMAEPVAPDFEDAPLDLPEIDAAPMADETPTTPKDRLERWQRKLLDL
ncbi:MAG: hypothetical protein K2Q10_02530, partial [Rhodospirillales bacterium]|nr:hypothetical protein [Rhodospirillales bacterium]